MDRHTSGDRYPAHRCRSTCQAFSDPAVTIVAHNAGFERTVLSGPPGRRIGIPALFGTSLGGIGTAARAAHVGLPRALERACAALAWPFRKIKRGMPSCCGAASLVRSTRTVIRLVG